MNKSVPALEINSLDPFWSEINYQRLFTSSPGLYLILSPSAPFHIKEVSDAYLEATLTRREEIINKPLFDVFPDNPEDPLANGVNNLRQSLYSVLHSHQKSKMTVQRYDIRNENGKFERRYWCPVNYPVLNEKGKLLAIIHKVLDVTYLEGLKQDKDHLIVELQTALNELESFSYTVSHDLRAPLRAINSFTDIMFEEHAQEMGPECHRLLNIVRNNGRKMGKLIDELLEFSRIGRKEVKRIPIDLGRMLDSIVEDLSAMEAKGVEFEIANIPRVHGDYALVRQVFTNILANAVKYSSKCKHPRVEVTASENENEIIIGVHDNGVGFDSNYADKLFKVFERLHHNSEFEGSGVGLAIARKIVEKHGGRIWAESAPGKGAHFYTSFPKPYDEKK